MPDSDEGVQNLMGGEGDPQEGAATEQQPTGENSESQQSEGQESTPNIPEDVETLRTERDELKKNVSGLQNTLLNERRSRPQNQSQDEGYSSNLPQPGEDGYDQNTHLIVAASDHRAKSAEAANDVRSGVEKIMGYYPEFTKALPELAEAIRSNPMSFASKQYRESLDIENMVTDVEEFIADHVEKIQGKIDADKKSVETASSNEGKSVGANPPGVSEGEGEESEESNWTKPLTELEKDIKKMRKQKGINQ